MRALGLPTYYVPEVSEGGWLGMVEQLFCVPDEYEQLTGILSVRCARRRQQQYAVNERVQL